MLSLKQALHFGFSFFTAYIAMFALLYSIISITYGIICLRLHMTLSDAAWPFVLVGFTIFVRMLISAKKTVFNITSPLSCSFQFFVKQIAVTLLISIPPIICALILAHFIGGYALFWCIPFILLALTAHIQDFQLRSIVPNMVLIIKHPFSFLLLIVYAAACCTGLFFLAHSIEKFAINFLQGSSFLLLPCSVLFATIFLFVIFVIVKLIYNFLPRKGRFFFALSLLLIIPSTIIYSIVGLPFNFLLFIVLYQILWYAIFSSWFIVTAGLGILTHLMAQISYNFCAQQSFIPPDDQVSQ